MASGNTLVVFTPYDNEPPSASYATLDVRNGQPCLDFDADADETAIFSSVMPSHYAGGGITVVLHCAFSTSTTNTQVANVECSVERGTTDKDADSFDTMTDGSVGVNATSGVETVATIALANNDSIVAGDHFRLRVVRDANGTNGTDDATGDMELYSIELRET
jgi:hypothetical protein